MSNYTHIPDHCLSEKNQRQVSIFCDTLEFYEADLAACRDPHATPILTLCEHEDDLAEIEALAAQLRSRFTHVIICGSGGSGLSGRVLTNLRLYPESPTIYTIDNIDPSAIEAVLQRCPLKQTLVIIISKSGSTAETLSQFYALLSHFKETLGSEIREHFIAITMRGESPLRQTASEHQMRILDHPADIGGRFSLFTIVGLLPAALIGLDIRALRRGALATIRKLGRETMHPARLGAALQYDAMQRGHSMSVMLPYCERLTGFSAWYRQSWSESLGKDGKGTTPITAVGTTDQHSQLQLYLAGPNDKFFTLILHKRKGTGQKINAPAMDGLEYLQGKTTGDIMEAEQKATLETLVSRGRLVRVIQMEQLDEESLGSLIMHFMLEIFFMSKLLGVNAFDQPAVEEGKQRARDYLLGGAA